MINRLFVLTILICLFSFNKIVSAQAPVNDDCIGAILLNVSPDYQGNYISGTTGDATDSGMNDACNGVGDDDVWYKFGVINTSQWVFLYPYSNDAVMSFYTGTCMSLDSLTCVNEEIGNSPEIKLLQGLTIGDTIFIRVFEVGSSPTEMEFGISAYAPPINDVCIDAIEIVPIPNGDVSTSITTSNAIDENTPTGSCGDNLARDIWYKFTPTQSYCKVTLWIPSDVNRQSRNIMSCEYVVELRNGSCSGTQIDCFKVGCYEGQNYMERNDFVIGDTYFIRLYTSDNSTVNKDTRLIITEPELEPEDNCLSAELLYVNDYFCSYSYNNSLGGATETTIPTDSCSVGPYLDLWYKFEVTNVAAIIKASVNSNGNIAFAAFTGSTCGNLTHLQCANDTGDGQNESLYLSGLTLGDTIYIRVYDADIANTPINFNICVYTPPMNDFCANAIHINTTNGANCSGSIAGNSQGATGTGGCNGGSADDDVWFWFTASDTLHQIQLSNTSISTPIIEIFNLDCSGSQFACFQGVHFVSSNFIIGQKYYIRIYSNADQVGMGSFNICISEPPVNIFCKNATRLMVNQDTACTLFYTGNSVGQGYSKAKYIFEASAATQIIYIKPLSPLTNISNNLEILNDTCAFVSNIGYNYYNGIQRTYFKNFIIGDDYVFEVYNGYPVEGNYEICITEAIDNDECAQAIPISESSINTNCSCDVTVFGSCKGATPSVTSGFYQNQHDVWYSFTAISTVMAISLNGSVVGAVYVNDCTTELGYIYYGGLTLQNLVIGNTYKLRVVAPESDYEPGDFTICIKSFSNDYCSNPTVIIPSAGIVCTNPVQGTTIGATPGNIQYCSSPNTVNVWYKFTATATTHLVRLKPLTPGFFPQISVFKKSSNIPTCDNDCVLSTVSCINSEDTTNYKPRVHLLNSLSVGTTYLIEIGNRNSISPSGDFNICVLSPGTSMNVWSTKVESYNINSIAHAGQYEFPTKKITLNMTGTTIPKSVTQIVINTNGTSQTSDLLTAKLYYAGASYATSPLGSLETYKSVKSPGEQEPILFGSAIMNPSGQLIFNGNQSIVGQTGEYKRYFFLVYNVACNASVGNHITADVGSITISSDLYTPYVMNNIANNIEAQNRYYTQSDGLWSNANTWLCGVPPNGPAILPITLYHNVTVDDARQSGNIDVSNLKVLHINDGKTLTLGQSSQGNQTGHSNKILSSKWGKISIAGTLNVNGRMNVGDNSGNGTNQSGELVLNGTLNIDGNDGTLLGSGFSSLVLETSRLSGSGFINILDPSYSGGGGIYYDSRYYQDVRTDWTITFGGGDDNTINTGILSGFNPDFVDDGNGSTFSTLSVKDVHIAGGMLAQNREVALSSIILGCKNLWIHENSEFIGAIGISGNLVNDGVFTGSVYPNLGRNVIVCASNFGWKSFLTNNLNQSISGKGFFRANATLPYPTSKDQNNIRGLYVQTSANVTLQTPLQVTEEIFIKYGKVITSDTSLLSLGTTTSSGILCQENISFNNYDVREYTGALESWTGGGIQGPFKRYFQNNTTQEYKGYMPLRYNALNRIIGFNLKNNTQSGSIVARFRNNDYGAICLPLLNEQGINITNSSPSGYWQYKTDSVGGDYDITVNANGFVKRGTGTITNLSNIRGIVSPNIPTFIHSNSTTSSGPAQLTKVMLQHIAFHQDTFVVAIGGGNNAAGNNLGPNNFTVTSTLDSGSGSFREAITLAMCNDTIRFAPLLNGDTVLLTQTMPNISKNVVVYMSSGQNIVIAYDLEATLLDIPQHYVVELLNTSISGVNQSLPLIINYGQLILDNCAISNTGINNNAPVITNEDNGKIIIKNDCTISNK